MSITSAQQKDINKCFKEISWLLFNLQRSFWWWSDTYTALGYDKLQRIQVVSSCCIDKVARPILWGLCSCYDPKEINNLMKDHPLASQFWKKL